MRNDPIGPCFLALILFLAFGVSSTPALAAGALDELIDRTVKTYGGEEALRRSAAVRETGKVTSLLRGGTAGDIVREFERPDRLRVVVRYGSDTEVRIFDGKTGWREGRTVTGPPLDAMVLQAARLALPLILLDRKANLVDRGTSAGEGTELRILDLPLAKGLTLTVGIDPASGRIVRSSGTGGMGMGGKPLEFVTRYDDFRFVDGVLRPFREENYANGFVTGETILSRVVFPGSFAPETFRP